MLIRACIILGLACPFLEQSALSAERPVSADVEADPTYYAFHPMSVMSLGLGFNPSDMSQAKIRCIDADIGDLETGALNTQFRTLYVTNHEQMQATFV